MASDAGVPGDGSGVVEFAVRGNPLFQRRPAVAIIALAAQGAASGHRNPDGPWPAQVGGVAILEESRA